MTSRLAARVSQVVARDDRARYDGMEMALHWATALLVVILYALSQIWSFLPRGTPLRLGMQSVHVSLGILLAAVLVTRIVWRLGPGRRVSPATTGLMELASDIVHYALYALLLAAVMLGFCFRWAQHEPLSFFGLFTIPSPYPFAKEQAGIIGDLHWWVATTIIVVAGFHAAAALLHHYVLRDDVLLRMLPGHHSRHAAARPPILERQQGANTGRPKV
jgi:cytochrome b561